MHVVRLAPDYTGDGVREIAAGGLDDEMRLFDGRSGDQMWHILTEGAIKDAIIAPDLDADGLPDIIFCTEGSTVNAVSSADASALWTYFSETPATFWSLTALPDVDGDGVADLAAGSALNIVLALRSVPRFAPDSVTDLACVAAQTPGGPGVLFTWSDVEGAEVYRVALVTEGGEETVGEVAAGVQQLLVTVTDAADPRDYSVTAIGPGGESEAEVCRVTMAPPSPPEVRCELDDQGHASASWDLPDPGLRELDGIRVLLDGSEVALLPPTATSIDFGSVSLGIHLVAVRTVWGAWDSPDYTCTLELGGGIDDLLCVAAQTASGPGVLLTWTDPPGAETIRVVEETGGAGAVSAEIPAGVGQLLTAVSGNEDPRIFTLTPFGGSVDGTPASCTITMTPPPVPTVSCGNEPGEGGAWASWPLPEPGLRELDGMRVILDGTEVALLPPTEREIVLGTLAPAPHVVVVRTVWGPWDSPGYTCMFTVEVDPGETAFVRSDANGDGSVDISDAVATLGYLFSGLQPTCVDAMDGNGDGKVDISDAVFLLGYLFGGGEAPSYPFPDCGIVVGANCETFAGCP